MKILILSDPSEMNDLADDPNPAIQATRADLQARFDASREDQPLKNSHINLWGPFRSRWFMPGASWAAADNPARANKTIEAEECEANIDFRNGGKAHVLFVDGHVQRMGPEDFRYRMFTNAY